MNLSDTHNKTDWQIALSNAVTNPKELLTLLDLDLDLLDSAIAASKLFPLKVPRSFIQRMEKGNVNDPLLCQVLPLHAEFDRPVGYALDPLQEATTNPIPGLLHKYHGRVLLTTIGSCAINCRYCFRRAFPYAKNNPGTAGWFQAVDYIAQDTSINEIILSGGDPLLVNDMNLQSLIEKLAVISHVKRLRIHSRLPIVLPERITPELIHALTTTRLKIVVVVHSNHPNEINHEVTQAASALTQANILVLNQSVLLKNINDTVDTLVALSDRLFEINIQPYYLHVLDKVQGAAHFDLPIVTAQRLHWEMAKRLPGYLVPRLVCEQAGAPAKLPLGTSELYTD